MLGDRIKDERKKRGMSRAALAAACGKTVPAFSMYERNDSTPSAETLSKICRALNVSADYLLGLDEMPAAHNMAGALDPEHLDLAAQISGAVYEIAQLDQNAAYERDCLTICGMMLESVRALIADTDAAYSEMLQQLPAFTLDAAADPAGGLSDLQQQQQKERETIAAFEDLTLYRADHTGRGVYALIAAALYKRLIGKPYDKTPVELPGKTYTITADNFKKNAKIVDRRSK